MEDKNEIVEAEPRGLDISTPQAVMATPKQLEKQMERDQELRKVLNKYIDANMEKGKDYGSITVKGKNGGEFTSKPSLLKPGAEKFCSLFKVRPTFRKDTDTWEMLGNTPGIVAYVCELVDGRGRVIGEGRGTAKADLMGHDFDVNKAVKIAEKRAQIDAVLRTGCLSDFFTQDVEDAPKGTFGNKPSTSHPVAASKPSTTEKPSDQQVKFIRSLESQKGKDHLADDVMPKTKAEASEMIKELMALPSVQKETANASQE